MRLEVNQTIKESSKININTARVITQYETPTADTVSLSCAMYISKISKVGILFQESNPMIMVRYNEILIMNQRDVNNILKILFTFFGRTVSPSLSSDRNAIIVLVTKAICITIVRSGTVCFVYS